MEDTKVTRPSKSTGSMHTRTHRDWTRKHKDFTGQQEMGFLRWEMQTLSPARNKKKIKK